MGVRIRVRHQPWQGEVDSRAILRRNQEGGKTYYKSGFMITELSGLDALIAVPPSSGTLRTGLSTTSSAPASLYLVCI